jgi:hypothetical protein
MKKSYLAAANIKSDQFLVIEVFLSKSFLANAVPGPMGTV